MSADDPDDDHLWDIATIIADTAKLLDADGDRDNVALQAYRELGYDGYRKMHYEHLTWFADSEQQ